MCSISVNVLFVAPWIIWFQIDWSGFEILLAHWTRYVWTRMYNLRSFLSDSTIYSTKLVSFWEDIVKWAIIYFVRPWIMLFSVNKKSIMNWKQKLIIWRDIFHWKSKFWNCCVTYTFIFDKFFWTFGLQTFKFRQLEFRLAWCFNILIGI